MPDRRELEIGAIHFIQLHGMGRCKTVIEMRCII